MRFGDGAPQPRGATRAHRVVRRNSPGASYSSSSSSFRLRQLLVVERCLACEADFERLAKQSLGFVGQDFSELSRVAVLENQPCGVLEQWSAALGSNCNPRLRVGDANREDGAEFGSTQTLNNKDHFW
jgi:hypothetical protein